MLPVKKSFQQSHSMSDAVSSMDRMTLVENSNYVVLLWSRNHINGLLPVPDSWHVEIRTVGWAEIRGSYRRSCTNVLLSSVLFLWCVYTANVSTSHPQSNVKILCILHHSFAFYCSLGLRKTCSIQYTQGRHDSPYLRFTAPWYCDSVNHRYNYPANHWQLYNAMHYLTWMLSTLLSQSVKCTLQYLDSPLQLITTDTLNSDIGGSGHVCYTWTLMYTERQYSLRSKQQLQLLLTRTTQTAN